ncbi:hypothetical protein [Janthinobacterium sp. PC23-8]|uniref:hypothetical protein n=1 Tax=Janthinobacterium sp. PC23-8 TaxID=2012679 RepID=UPI000B96B96C|nr:hypothetical protein [Janthinobacterium sp. PC23-8]OYO31738.1 hypothetical protein CD932_11835 [Janthinobacterium sp. PC23-8]
MRLTTLTLMRRLARLALLAPLLPLAACVQGGTPRFDARFGQATRLAMAQQVQDPAAAGNTAPANGLDGASARAVMERYRASFAEPNGQVAPPVSFLLGGNGGK